MKTEQESRAGRQARISGFFRGVGALVVVVAVVFGGMYFWNRLALERAEQRFAAEKAEFLRKAATQHAQDQKSALLLFSRPLAWAVRREMMSGNLDQIDQYFTELVRLKGFQRLVLAKADGTIAVSSDRKFLGSRFDSVYPARYLTVGQITVEEPQPGHYLIVVPIVGLSARLGVLVIAYVPPGGATSEAGVQPNTRSLSTPAAGS
jgi:hypothetical protein